MSRIGLRVGVVASPPFSEPPISSCMSISVSMSTFCARSCLTLPTATSRAGPATGAESGIGAPARSVRCGRGRGNNATVGGCCTWLSGPLMPGKVCPSTIYLVTCTAKTVPSDCRVGKTIESSRERGKSNCCGRSDESQVVVKVVAKARAVRCCSQTCRFVALLGSRNTGSSRMEMFTRRELS